MPDIFISRKKQDKAKVVSARSQTSRALSSVAHTEVMEEAKTEENVNEGIVVADTAKSVVPLSHATHTTNSRISRTPIEETHAKHSMNPLAAFALDPEGVAFANQGENEEVHLFLRKHFITNVPWIVLAILLLTLPIVLAPFTTEFVPILGLISPSAQFLLLMFYYVIVLGVALTNFINWYFNVYIVTTERIVDVDFINILYREISATRLNLIQDVTVKSGGVIRAIFNYGDVFVQTAGTEVNFDFIAVPKAQEVAREIERLMEQARKREGVSDIEEALK